jgi:NADPH:quinone reductase
VFGHGVGITRDGTLSEVAAVPQASLYAFPEGADDALAAACGIAGLAGWVPVTRRADVGPDDTVLVLGATGTVGRVALQAARLRGARRIVAAGRNPERLERARELGADATVQVDQDFERALRDAFDGDGPTVVIDPLWGEPAAAAVRVARAGARPTSAGASCGSAATPISPFPGTS